jgi:phosphatidylinositol alpha-1,6-mannosyltransferase
MKRLLVTCEYPPTAGGQGTYLKSLWADLDPLENRLLVPAICRVAENTSSTTRFCFVRLPAGEGWAARIARLTLLALAMVRLSLAWRPAEIHVGQLIVGGGCALVIKTILRIPFVVHCHGSDLLEFSRYRWARPVIRRIFTQSHRIIANSLYTAGRIRELYGAGLPVVVVNPCVDDLFYTRNDSLAAGLREQFNLAAKRVVVTIGRLVERKGHDVVIKALAELMPVVPDLHYCIVGDGPYRAALEELVGLHGLSTRVTFCGAVPRPHLPSYYRLGELFVMVPRLLADRGDVEGFGIVFLEANAAGLPVIASRSGGIVDAVKDGFSGILIDDPLNSRALALALKRILGDDPLRQTLAGNAIAWAQQFSRDAQRKVWHDAIQ